MGKLVGRFNAAPGVVGLSLLLPLLLVRAAASASAERVFVFGRELHWECLFKKMFGVPCPTCGMTRSVLLALDGQLVPAFALNPAGPLLVAGVLLFCAAMFFLTFYHSTRPAPRALGRIHGLVRLGSAAYGGLLVAVLAAHWLSEIF
ncbi:MAG: DUF2752 domain-containing protein [Pyrinomonadaceae bacterium]